ncbi:UNVERIFIED_CONTAM: hypothetical protein FKN15_029303 [Acipenser sinensis]
MPQVIMRGRGDRNCPSHHASTADASVSFSAIPEYRRGALRLSAKTPCVLSESAVAITLTLVQSNADIQFCNIRGNHWCRRGQLRGRSYRLSWGQIKGLSLLPGQRFPTPRTALNGI